jgi:hypothetical protein
MDQPEAIATPTSMQGAAPARHRCYDFQKLIGGVAVTKQAAPTLIYDQITLHPAYLITTQLFIR